MSKLNSREFATELSSLKNFKRVLLCDSSSWQLRDKLSKDYKGCGGNGFRAGCKLQMVFDAKNSPIVQGELLEGKDSDHAYATDKVSRIIKKGDLVIFDLGYYSADVL